MEVSVYMSLEAMRNNKPVFKRMVMCPDLFDSNLFVQVMKSIFGNSIVINILYT